MKKMNPYSPIAPSSIGSAAPTSRLSTTLLQRESPREASRRARPASNKAARPVARIVMEDEARRLIYPEPVLADLEDLLTFAGPPLNAADVEADPSLLAEVEVLVSGWGPPRLDRRVLSHAQSLKVVLYGGGATGHFVTEHVASRGIRVYTANGVNAVPVVEYTVAQVIMCLKRVWQHTLAMRDSRQWRRTAPGATGFGSRVGIVGVGDIGRRVIAALRGMDIDLVAYDICPDPEFARELDFEYLHLEELFAVSDVVSLHVPLNDLTHHLIDASLMRSMKQGASLINTARGALIDQPALLEIFARRPDLFAVLDVTDPEPPGPDSPLWQADNIVLTPHLAGSLGPECRRMGEKLVDDLRQYLADA